MIEVKCEMELSAVYKIVVDPKVWTPSSIKDWESVFWPVNDIKGLAKSLAEALVKGANPRDFIEGFGKVREIDEDGNISWWCARFKPKEFCEGIYFTKVIGLDVDEIECIEKEVES